MIRIRHVPAASVLLAAVALGCSESTAPENPSPVAISLPANSGVAALAASNDNVFTLRTGTGTSRVLEARQTDGTVVWTQTIPSGCSGGECILAVDAANNLYLDTDAGLMSRTNSGSLRWTATPRLGSIAVGTGTRLFGAGRPFTGTQSVYAIESATGATAWTTALAGGFDAVATLLDEARSTVYAIGRGRILALDTQSGTVKWTVTRSCFPSVGAIATDGTIYMTCDSDMSSSLYAFDASGTQKWFLNLSTNAGTFTPIIDAAGTVYVANTGSVTAVSPAGQVVWKVSNLGAIRGTPVLDSDQNLYVVASQTGSAGPRTLLVLANGNIAADRGAAPCESSMLLLPTGRAFCASVDGLVRFGTNGYPSNAQWSQFGRDYRRTNHR